MASLVYIVVNCFANALIFSNFVAWFFNITYKMEQQEDLFKKIVSHAKEYGFVFQ